MSPDALHRGARYEAEDLEAVCIDPDYLTGAQAGPRATAGVTARTPDDAAFAPADLEAIEEKCAFMAQARDHPERQTEPWWYRQLSIIGRCAGDQELAHERSRGHPGYSPRETEQKLEHALRAGPATCVYVEQQLGFTGCASCIFRGKIKSPVQLGRQVTERVGEAPPDDGAPHPGTHATPPPGVPLRVGDDDAPRAQRGWDVILGGTAPGEVESGAAAEPAWRLAARDPWVTSQIVQARLAVTAVSDGAGDASGTPATGTPLWETRGRVTLSGDHALDGLLAHLEAVSALDGLREAVGLPGLRQALVLLDTTCRRASNDAAAAEYAAQEEDRARRRDGRGGGGGSQGGGGQGFVDREEARRDRTRRLAESIAIVYELPEGARLGDAERQQGEVARAVWLEQYVTASRKLAPRAPAHYHEACGLAALCIAIARRAYVPITAVKRVYASFMAVLDARSTAYSKTEVLAVLRDALRLAGADDALLASSWTAAALGDALALRVPQSVRDGGSLVRQQWLERNRHAGQRGVIRDETAGFLADATTEYGTGLIDYLLKLDGAPGTLDGSLTLSRGAVVPKDVSLTMIGATTPAALRPAAMKPLLWANGFFARLLPLGPLVPPHWVDWPQGVPAFPAAVVDGLRTVHRGLGLPEVRFEFEDVPARKKDADPEQRIVGAVQERYTPVATVFSPEARARCTAYNRALFDLCLTKGFPDRLSPLYGRLPELATRFALALAISERLLITGTGTGAVIGIGHWAAAQGIAETWRAAVHQALSEIVVDPDAAEDEQVEDARPAIDSDRAGRLVRRALELRAEALADGQPDPGLTLDDTSTVLGKRGNSQARHALLAALCEQGVFERQDLPPGPQGGRPVVIHRLTEAYLVKTYSDTPVDVRGNGETPPTREEPLRGNGVTPHPLPDGEGVFPFPRTPNKESRLNAASEAPTAPEYRSLEDATGGASSPPSPAPEHLAQGDVGFPLDAGGVIQTAEPVAITEVVFSAARGAEGWYFRTNDPQTATAYPVAQWLPQDQAEAQGVWPSSGPAEAESGGPAYQDF